MAKIAKLDLGEFPLWLAPMEAVTNAGFRNICKREGADVLVTEFISSEALIRDAGKSISKMRFSQEERPIAVQIFGHDEKSMRLAAEIAAESKPDFIDINWGCPVRKIVSKGAGSGILRDIPKMVSITSQVVGAMREVGLPVTVKTRLGWDETDKPIVEVAERLQDIGIEGISIHGRTRSQQYSGIADWTLIRAVKENKRMRIPVFGNGDIDSAEKALEYRQKYGVDGMLIGRASIGYPWIFREIKHYFSTGELLSRPSIEDRIKMCLQHFKEEIELKGERVAAQEMKIHYSGYLRYCLGFKPYKVRLMLSNEYEQVEGILNEYKNKN